MLAEGSRWFKYEYVCSYCDSLVSYTTRDVRDGWDPCPICPEKLTLMSVEDATIENKTEGEAMQDISRDELSNRITSLENRLAYQEKQIGQIIDNLNIDSWYANTIDKEEVLRDLCTILEHEAKATLNWSASLTVEGSVDVALDEVEDFDIRMFLNDQLSIDSGYGDAVIDSWHVEDVEGQDWS